MPSACVCLFLDSVSCIMLPVGEEEGRGRRKGGGRYVCVFSQALGVVLIIVFV